MKIFSSQLKISHLTVIVCMFLLGAYLPVVSSNLYSIQTNLEDVETLAINYANGISEMQNLALEPTGEFCDMPKEMKITLCWHYLRNEEYEFEFTFNMDKDEENIECDNKKFILRWFDQERLVVDQIRMFQCTELVETPFLKQEVNYYFSDSHLESTAIVFIQEGPYGPIHPHKYLEAVNFKELQAKKLELYESILQSQSEWKHWVKRYKNQQKRFHISTLPIGDIRKLVDSIQIRQHLAIEAFNKAVMVDWLHTRTFHDMFNFNWLVYSAEKIYHSAYKKFTVSFNAINICPLTFTQKIYMCRVFANNYKFLLGDVDVSEYTDAGCRKFGFNFDKKEEILTTMQCPPVIERRLAVNHGWYLTLYNPAVFFLITNLEPSSIFVAKLETRALVLDEKVENIDFGLVKKVKQVEKEAKFRARTKQIPAVPITSGYAGSGRPIPIKVNRKEAEKNVEKLGKIKAIKYPYRKLIAAYRIQNVCHLRKHQVYDLCKKIFEHQVFGYKIELPFDDLKCIPRLISLVAIEVTSVQELRVDAINLALITCPTLLSWPFPTQVFLSGSPEIGSVIALERGRVYFKINAVTEVHGIISKDVEISSKTIAKSNQ